MTVLLKTAVHPDEIDSASAIHCRGEQNSIAKVSIRREGGDGSNGVWTAPTCAAIGRGEDHNSRLARVANRHDDGAIRLNKRIATETGRAAGSHPGAAPGSAAITGRAHLDQIAAVVVVPLDVTMAVEVAGRRIITSDPVFIQSAIAADVGNGDGVAPGGSAI